MKLNRNKVSGNKPQTSSQNSCGAGSKQSASAPGMEYEIDEEVEVYKNK